jgi:hypothetical protein
MYRDQYDVAHLKDRLDSYRENEREIDNQIERLERLVSKTSGLGAQVISDMPRAHNVSDDRMAELVGQKEELEELIRAAVKEQSAERRALEGVMKFLRHSDERAVIRMRYFDRASWNEVVDLMFGGREDYLEKEESYLRRVHRIHGAALLNMAKIMEESDQDEDIEEAI